MGGMTQPRCETVIWRGIRVCKHSVPKLVAWAKRTGRVYLKGIQGCYSTAIVASGNTHAGGGVYDVEMDGYSRSEAIMSTNEGRQEFLITEDRPWGSADKPNHHIHLIDPECPNLSDAAMKQVEEYRRGETGLVGYDPDTYYRGNKVEMLRRYDNRLDVKAPSTGAHRTYTIPKGGTLGKAAAALGVTVAVLAGFNHISNPDVVRPGTVVTAPPSTYTVPAVTPTAKPTLKPTPSPVVKAKPKPVVKPKPKPVVVVKPVSRAALKAGKTNASVKAYEVALNKRGFLAKRYVDGYYGTATSAGTKALYRSLAKKQPNAGWTKNATVPGPSLLKVLKVKSTR
ncbi:LysM domain-containing protein [Terracoccus sp. 273MFTsu3.1]|uniref:LysM peptidoglycan-binding domain-containing protein n=1 Tax=Terracoccus sp. 273MFTsu3.1 TaxID=1172188 RepID=UPI00039A3F84|nr:LysM domain-containing protein [Terracoccus sp. 273MFTsu3.1]